MQHKSNLTMKKTSLQIVLILCVIIESFLIYKMIISHEIIYQELCVGLAIMVLLTIIRLINNLTDITYGNPEKN